MVQSLLLLLLVVMVDPRSLHRHDVLHHVALQVHLVLLVLGNISHVLGLQSLGLSSDLILVHHHVSSQCSGRVVATHIYSSLPGTSRTDD